MCSSGCDENLAGTRHQGWQPEVDFFARRRREIEQLAAYDLPDLFYRFDDLEQHNVNTRSVCKVSA